MAARKELEAIMIATDRVSLRRELSLRYSTADLPWLLYLADADRVRGPDAGRVSCMTGRAITLPPLILMNALCPLLSVQQKQQAPRTPVRGSTLGLASLAFDGAFKWESLLRNER